MTDRTHFFAVALAVLVTAGFTVGCANGSSTGAPSAAELANAEATYTGVINQVYGTPTQRKAAAERGWL